MFPQPFLMEWFKDRYNYPWLHTSEELWDIMALPREAVLQWLEEAVELVWASKATTMGRSTSTTSRFDDTPSDVSRSIR